MIRRTTIFIGLVLALGSACSSQSLKSGPNQDGDGPAEGIDGSVSGPSDSLSRAPYPEGPFGHGVGATIANLSFLGWHNAAKASYDPGRLEEVSLAEFYNPDGAPGRPRLLMVNASAVWCVVCKAEYRHIIASNVYGTFKPKGVEILGLLFEDAKSDPAKPSDLLLWGGPEGFDVPFPLVLDPSFKSGVYFESDATPMNMLIDTRNMQILKVTMGYNSSSPTQYWDQIDAWLAQ